MLNAKIVSLIKCARKTVEYLAKNDHEGGLWSYDNDLSLCGYCGISSRFLISLGKYHNIHNMKLVCGTFDNKTHCWILYDNNYYIDLTISQFSSFETKKYIVGKIDDKFYKQHYRPEMKGYVATSFQKTWEDGQAYEKYARQLWRIYKNGYVK
jgi:hypothetical protein